MEVSVTVKLVFEGAFRRHTDIFRLLGAQAAQFGADLREVKRGHLLIKFLRQRVDLIFILSFLRRPKLNLRERLVREGG